MARRELTEEQRQSLCGLMPFSADAVDEFTPELFSAVDEELRPVFKLRPFTEGEKERVTDAMKRIVADPGKIDQKEIKDFARIALVGWDNVLDVATGDDIPFSADSRGACDKATFALLPSATVNAILKRVNTISGLLSAEALGLRY